MFQLKTKLQLLDWDDPNHSIISDLIAIRRKSKNKITRAFLSEKMFGYMLSNKELLGLAAGQNAYPTIDWIKDYLLSLVKIEFIEWDETYKLSALGNDEKIFPRRYNFICYNSFATWKNIYDKHTSRRLWDLLNKQLHL